MVTQDSDLAIGSIISIQLLLKCGTLQRVLVKKALESKRCIVSTEDFGSQSLHLRGKMFVEHCSLQAPSVAV